MEGKRIQEYGFVEALEEDLKRLEHLAHLFDAAFRIPFLGVRFGWDSIVGLIPGIGDLLGVLPLVYYYKLATKYKLSRGLRVKIVLNQAIDFLLGLVPVLGDFVDIAWKANLRNARLLSESLEELKLGARRPSE